MSVKRAKKPKSEYSAEFRAGREKGENDTIELIGALLMQDYGFTIEEMQKFCEKICDWRSYVKDPSLPFYMGIVRKINKDNGLSFRRE